MSQTLTDAEIQAQMAQVPGWTVEGDRLQRTYRFKDFVEAIAFVNKLVEPAEAAGHHPDIAISYNRVTVTLTTHDAGGLTQKDFDLAASLANL
ncbi:4a-hydroxytetrahydrobiopterin dehydratase [Leptolyngbya sp. O-77]|uniref:4a-hydroxytetrahydrobiopterin dehydratase n=1 Tax=Leptolyngbya sp. O-77 TaxID=1080068 RepID=UPI00074D3041|nr:4a-hydroxytetrahydrobiopterin dehydratase [Leptolyngbya sp. O-77]BAU41126.1 Putative pterin-4-alpha-carbinolamine dehydratase [Leptolyngbya sp. O-77]